MTCNAFHDTFSDYLTSASVLPCHYKTRQAMYMYITMRPVCALIIAAARQ